VTGWADYLVGSLASTGAVIVGGALVWLGHSIAARREVLVSGETQLVTRWPRESRLRPFDQDDDTGPPTQQLDDESVESGGAERR
jgi:hypothetical protein